MATPPAVDLLRGPVVFGDVLAPKGWKVSVVSIDGTQEAHKSFGCCRPG
ncbi:MAG TPA: hypothetical protein VLB79_08245 [Solirubrobacterales bacterium]|nr:hypothetical protein [Solirubrobacterales bacterium]